MGDLPTDAVVVAVVDDPLDAASGLRLVFDQGRLMDAADFRAEGWDPEYQAGFPPLVFLQLLFGRRSLAELRHVFPDVWANQIARPLLEALFPARPSWVLPLE